MTSLVDLERWRTDYFDAPPGDSIEPSSSTSEGSPSPLRSLAEDAIAGLAGSPASTSHAADRDPVFSKHDEFHRFRKGHRSHGRDSSTSSSKKLSSLLLFTSERLEKESRRADDAERKVLEAIAMARSANEAKLIAQRDATRANEELRLYKLQYDNAQREIFKAQELIDQIEAERQEAEAAAARARSTARKLKEQNVIIMAREEGRLLGYQEGLATGRRMAYEERMRASDYTEESDSGDEVMLPDHPSNIRLRSPTPGAGSRPSSRPPGSKEPPRPPPPMRPPNRSSYAQFDSLPHPSALATAIEQSRLTQAGPPPPIHLEATPPPNNRIRDKSAPSSYPPDNWIPVANEKSRIAIPPPHHMSPSPTTFSLEPSVPVPIPPPPVIDEDAPVETPTMGKTTSQMVPMRPAIPLEDYVSGQPQRSRTQAPSSPGMSDFGTLNLPYSRTASRVPFEVRHFEIERSPSREKINRKNKETIHSSPARVGASPALVPPLVTESMIASPRPRRPGKSPLSRMSQSSPSSSSPTIAKLSSSNTSSTEGAMLKRRKDRLDEKGNTTDSGSKGSMSINIQSPSESDHSTIQDDVPQEPSLLSPGYRPAVLAEPSTSTPKTIGGNQGLPPLSGLTNLVSPGQEGGPVAGLPPGFVPNSPLTDQVQQSDRGGGQSLRRPTSAMSKGKDKKPTYEVAPLTPGLHYPTSTPGGGTPRPKSRASRSSRQGRVSGSLDTP